MSFSVLIHANEKQLKGPDETLQHQAGREEGTRVSPESD